MRSDSLRRVSSARPKERIVTMRSASVVAMRTIARSNISVPTSFRDRDVMSNSISRPNPRPNGGGRTYGSHVVEPRVHHLAETMASAGRLERARARDRRATHLNGGHEADDRTHSVRAPPVAREALRTEKVDPREEVERAHRVANVGQRARDFAVLDEEGSVTGRSGHGRGTRVGRVRVVESRDKDPAPHRTDELLAGRRPAGHREVSGVAARGVARRVRRMTRGPRAP